MLGGQAVRDSRRTSSGRYAFMRGVASFGIVGAVLGVSAIASTSVTLSKSGNDLVITGAGGSADYTLTKSDDDPRFGDPDVLTLPVPSVPSYTYVGGLTNGVNLQFFDMTGRGEVNRGYTGGATPPPVPTITSVTPDTGTGFRVGDIIKFTGAGYSTIAEEDVVHFPEGIAVKALSGSSCTGNCTEPTITVFWIRIPRGALSGPVRVQVGHQVSDAYTLVVYTQDGLSNVSGIAQQPNTRDIWVTTRGTTSVATKAQYLRFTTPSWPATVVGTGTCCTQKYLGGQGFDSGLGWFFGFSNTEVDGKTRKEDTTASPPGAPAVWSSLFLPGGGQSAQVLGVATSSTLADEAFFAYNNTTIGQKHIRVLAGCTPTPCTNLVDGDYGNFGATNLNFASLAGLAFDGFGNLYDTETTQVRKIKPDETSSIVVSGLTQAMGIAHDQINIADLGTLLVVDSPTGFPGILYKVDLTQTTQTKDVVVSGLNAPRAATFASTPLTATACPPDLPNVDLSFVLAGDGNSIRQLPDPRITIEPSSPTRVWISKTRWDDGYPTNLQTLDRQIKITAKVTPVPDPQRTIYFRVVDPPEISPYADGTVIGTWCDNRDTNPNSGVFTTGNIVASALTDQNTGEASVTLQVTDHFAGDDYIVQASFDNWTLSNTTKALAQTGIITAWKRAYIEKDKMLRQGGLLSQDAPAGSTSIFAYDWAVFPEVPVCLGGSGCGSLPGGAPCYQIDVFDSVINYEGPHDQPYVGYITCPIGGILELHLVKADGSSYPLSYGYTSSPYPSFEGGIPTQTMGNSGGFGVFGSAFYEAEIGDQWSTYDDAFVEFWTPPEGGATTAYLPPAFFNTTPLPAMYRYSQVWFNNKVPLPPSNDWMNSPHNYFHLMGVSAWTTPKPLFGYTHHNADASYVFVAVIEGPPPNACGTDVNCQINVRRSTALHEIVHQFYVNHGPACTTLPGHDENPPTNFWNAWCGEPGGPCRNLALNTERCLMSGAGDSGPLGQFAFDSDTINRLECEDLNTPFPPCVHTDCGTGVRDMTDPE